MASRQLPLFPTSTEHALTRHSFLAAAFDPFLEHLRQQGCSPHTIKAFASDMRLVLEFFGDDMVLNDFTTTKLNRFMAWIVFWSLGNK